MDGSVPKAVERMGGVRELDRLAPADREAVDAEAERLATFHRSCDDA